MVFNTDKFISCIQNSPSIWEVGSKDYMDKNIKEKSWNTICEYFYENWNEKSNTEKQNTVKEMKTKWRHIRDNYSKYINQAKSGDSAPKKKYVYAESLSFLQHVIKKRRTTGNFNELGQDNNGDETEEEEEEINITVGADEIERNENSPPSTFQKNKTGTSITELRRKKCKKNNVTQFQQELLSALNNPEEENNSDPDKAFLVSLLPDYKRLTYEQKTDFRIMTLQYFRQISLEANQSQPLYDVHHNATYPSIPKEHYTSQLTLPILSTYASSTSDSTLKVPPQQAQHSIAFPPLHSSGSYIPAGQNASSTSDSTLKVPPQQAQHSIAFPPLHSSGSYIPAGQNNANTISDYYKNYQ
ncbi:uncharacterized protein LOC132952958 [Metopolophium dirhodum]|uniref:uncharacterized protein LOC132952958 n=1 Tax=Metopolophium dirhodum TaxID=44670 RepID=UPI0029904806|nr:uncharacterized protein LOC132952958 [Metopolophium dirhodum]